MFSELLLDSQARTIPIASLAEWQKDTVTVAARREAKICGWKTHWAGAI
jgi:hypothetical protein